MKLHLLCAAILITVVSSPSKAQNLPQEYIREWKSFYPSSALARGIRSSLPFYEQRHANKIEWWIKFNKESLSKIEGGNAIGDKIDLRLLKVQIQRELDTWEKEQPHKHSLVMYASLISRALPSIMNVDYLTRRQKNNEICVRLAAMMELAMDADVLESVDKNDANRGIRMLESTLTYLKNEFPKEIEDLYPSCNYSFFANGAMSQIQELLDRAKDELLPKATESSPLLGRDEYARQLALYTDSDLTPERLAEIALEEINLVRGLIGDVSRSYLKSTYPNKELPSDIGELTQLALTDMEKDAPINAQDYLKFWQDLKVAAVDFIKEHKIATLPKNETLQIKTAPESAGAAARIGWVASAPPFDPNPMTTLYLPSIPETLPKQEQIDFWRSFNKPFNRMIVIHELYPGHYMQLKISRETPHHIRLLFPYGTYIEGWTTFIERVLLDEGWENDNPLTFLAHLRKRIENANRAYTSVQVHTNGWTQDQVMKFSMETSLVAPQFAKSLWGRIMRSPMQLTSYFLGGAQFTKLLADEKERLGDKFDLQLFMDTIMIAGPIPIDEFYGIFKEAVAK